MNKSLKSVKYVLTPVIAAFLFIPISSGYSQTEIYVHLQGSHRPEPNGWEVPLTVAFFEPGANVVSDPNLYSFDLTASKSGEYAFCEVWGVPPNSYDITVVSEHTLLNVKRDVLVSDPNCLVYMGTLLEGNADDNRRVNLLDFAILGSSWLRSAYNPAFDSRADFDRNDNVDGSDLSLLTTNWLRPAPFEVPSTTEITAVCKGEMCELIEPEQTAASITFTGSSSIHLESDFFSSFTQVDLYSESFSGDITGFCDVNQVPNGPRNSIDVSFNSYDLPIGPSTWARYTIQLNPLPPPPSAAKTSDQIWVLTDGPEPP